MAHDLAATRRVRKGLLPGATEPRATPEPAPDAAAPLAPVVRERVVADVRHEIGNHFHKLYYWADFLAESRSAHSGDVAATQMLEETIHALERLLQATLEYVRPLGAAPIRMRAREVVEALVRQLVTGLPGRTVAPDAGEPMPDEIVLLVDPGRLSQLVGFLVRRLDATMDRGHALDVRIAVEVVTAGEAVVVRVTGTPGAPTHTTLGEVEWATAENVARIAGGELTTHEAGGRATIALAFPLRR
jgi:hypothetical protein